MVKKWLLQISQTHINSAQKIGGDVCTSSHVELKYLLTKEVCGEEEDLKEEEEEKTKTGYVFFKSELSY